MFISFAFLICGLIRLGVGSLLLGQEIGLLDFQAFHEAIHLAVCSILFCMLLWLKRPQSIAAERMQQMATRNSEFFGGVTPDDS